MKKLTYSILFYFSCLILFVGCVTKKLPFQSFYCFNNNSNISTIIDSLDKICLKNKIQLDDYSIVYAENKNFVMVIYQYKKNNDSIFYLNSDMFFKVKKTLTPTSNFYEYFNDTLSLNYITAKKEFLKLRKPLDFYQPTSYDTLGYNYIKFVFVDTLLSGLQPIYVFKENRKGKLVDVAYEVKSFNHKTKLFR